MRVSEFLRVSLTSMLSMSPYSYGLLQPSASIPVARCGVSWEPKLDFPSELRMWRRLL